MIGMCLIIGFKFLSVLMLDLWPQLGHNPPAVPQSHRKTYWHAVCCCHGNPAVTVYLRSGITRFRSESCLRRTGPFILRLLATSPAPTLLTGTKDICWEVLCDLIQKSFMHKATVLHSTDFPLTSYVTLLVIVTLYWLYGKHILSSGLCFDLCVLFFISDWSLSPPISSEWRPLMILETVTTVKRVKPLQHYRMVRTFNPSLFFPLLLYSLSVSYSADINSPFPQICTLCFKTELLV